MLEKAGVQLHLELILGEMPKGICVFPTLTL